MKTPQIPPNESERLTALNRYKILDTLPEQEYDDLTQLAADICGTPIALISLVDRDRQWFKSRCGLDASETPRDISFCGHAVAENAILNIPDTAKDSRFADNPLVTQDPKIRFYVGIPLITPDLYTLGTLCVIDRQPRDLTQKQIQQLKALSRLVISQLELRRGNEASRLLVSVVDSSDDAIITKTLDGIITSWNASAQRIFGYLEQEAIGQPMGILIPPDREEEERQILAKVSQNEQIEHFETVYIRKNGNRIDVSTTISPIRDREGIIIQASIIVRDISYRKESEVKLAQLEYERGKLLESYTTELERKVVQRTIDLNTRFEREQLIGKIAVKIAASLYLPEILEASVQELRAFLGCDRLLIWQLQSDGNGKVVAESVDRGWRSSLHDDIDDPCFRGDVALRYGEGHTIAISNIHTHGYPKCYIKLLDFYQVKSNLVVPIKVSGQLWGLLIGHQCLEYRVWQDDDLRLLDDMAVQMAIAIQQANAYQLIQSELTERQRTEAALRESEKRFVSLASAAPVGIFRTDVEGNCLYVNDRWCQIAGIRFEEAAGFGWINSIHPSDRELVEAEWNASIRECRPYQLEYRFQNPAGQITWAYGQAVAEHNEAGEIIGYVGTITDISDRKQAEAALQKLNQELEYKVAERTQDLLQVNSMQRAILDGADYSFISTDLNGIIQTFNAAAERMLGYSASEVVGKAKPALIHDLQEIVDRASMLSAELDRDIPVGFEVFVAKALLGIVFEEEWTYIRKDGSRFPVLLSISAMKDENQQIIGFLGIAKDISFRKQLEQQVAQQTAALQASEATNRKMLVAIPDLLLRLTRDGTCLDFISPEVEAEKFLHINNHISEVLPPELTQTQLQVIERAILTGELQVYEHKFVKHHRITYEEIRILAINDNEVLAIVRDISDRKQTELALKKSERRYRALMNNASDAIFQTDLQGDLIEANRRAESLLGYSLDELLRLPMSHIHPPEVLETISNHFRQIVQTGVGTILETLIVRKDGQQVPVEINPNVIDLGDEIVVQAIFRDISDRKQAEARVKRYENIISSTKDGIALLDRNYTYQIANQAYLSWCNKTSDQVIGASVRDILGSELFDTFIKPRLDRSLAGETVQYEQWFDYPNIVPQFLSVTYTPYLDINQTIAGIIVSLRDITKLKQAEQAIAKYAREVEDLYNNAPCGYHSLDNDGRIANINDTELQWLGYSREEILGKSFTEIVTAESSLIFQNNFSSFKRRGWIKNVEYDLICKDGTVFPVFLNATAVKDPEGNYLYSRSTLYDARDRKQAEKSIKESEARFRYLADHAPVLIWMAGLDKLCFYFNRPWLEFTGRTIEEELGCGWEVLLHPEDRQFYIDSYEAIFDTQQSFSMEYRLRRFDGQYRWLLTTGNPRFDADGEFLGYIGSCIDISDRKQAEQKLVENQKFIQKIAESSPNILYLYDLQENRNNYCNREITATLGYSPEEVQAMGSSFFANLMHPDDLANMPNYYQQIAAAEDGDIFEIEYRMRHANGEWRWLSSRDSVFSRDEQGHVKQTIGTAQDISDRKQSEITIQQTTAQLEASNRELEAFAYSVSHDLRAPLRAIDGFSNALLEDYGEQFGEEGKDYFDRIRRNVNRMGMLIDDLLRLSRISRSEMQYSNVNLSALVQEQLAELQILEPERQVEVVISPDVVVLGDATLMRVVISNLIQNAWKFTSHHATARIEFGVMQQEEQITYFVRDDGAGFDMNYAKMLFRVFQRLHNTNEFQGTGIGLATVQRAIHRHGGLVWAEGIVEKGATIYFTVGGTGQSSMNNSPKV